MVTKARRVAPYTSVVAFAMLAGCSATEDTRAPAVGEVASTLCSVVDDSGRVLV